MFGFWIAMIPSLWFVYSRFEYRSLYGHDTLTLQRNWQTDNLRQQYRALHYVHCLWRCWLFAVQHVRAAVHQLHQRASAAVLQPSHVRPWAGGIQEGRNPVGVHRLRHGSGSHYQPHREGLQPIHYTHSRHVISGQLCKLWKGQK